MSTPRSGVFFAIGSAVLMGTVGVFSKFMGIGAESVSFLRLFIGALFMFLFLYIKGETHHLRSKPSLEVCINGCFLAGFILFYVQAMNYTSMANAIMLVYFAPLTASIYAHFFFKERLRLTSFLLILLALLGFAMMLEFKLDLEGDGKKAIGLAYGIIAMFCYSGFILVNRKITAHVFNSTFYQLLTGGLIMFPFFLYSFEPMTFKLGLLALGVGFFPGFLAIFFAVSALRILPAATFGTLAYFEPLAVVIFGWSIFGESLSSLQLLGCAAILISGCVKTILDKS